MLLTISFFHGIKIIYPTFYLRSTSYDYHCYEFLSIEETTERLVSMFHNFRSLTVKKEILLHITIIFVNCILYNVKVLGIVVRLESLLSTAYIIMWTKRRTFSYCIFSGNITWFLVSIDNYIGVRERIIFFSVTHWQYCIEIFILIQRQINVFLVNFMICMSSSLMNTYI